MNVVGNQPESSADGPLIRKAYRAAETVDAAATSGQSAPFAMARVIAWGAAAMAEGFLRFRLAAGTILLSVIIGALGITSDRAAGRYFYLACGLIGVLLVMTMWMRKWPFARQWVVVISVLAADLGLLALVPAVL
ncbi:hypothetical protein [Nocardia sp. XZ_19_385]|uniref:hypothetical protein n=1 Tax=Nocardia sp. XZ_19_385 TaxID=2769488 RepID=UPI00188E3C08|nr:hypothetical protein [Nocardia sp. XZ_19_385]